MRSRAPRRSCARSTAGTPTANPLSSFTELKDDGSTVCGCWIYCGCYADGVNQTARRKPGSEQSWVAPEWGWAWPANRRIIYNRASADPDGKPWSERKRYVWWDADEGKWTGHDVPDFKADKAPDYDPPDGAKGRGGAERQRAVHHAGRRPRLALRARRAHRRAVPDPLRAARVAGRQPALRASRRTRRGSSSRAKDNEYNPTPASPAPTSSRT